MVAALAQAGWEVRVAVSAAGESWVTPDDLADAVVRSAHRDVDEPRERRRPDLVLVCPATFNTVNKLAAGIADTYTASLLAETLGDSTPLVAVPMVNDRLWGHPSWESNLAGLSRAGVTFVDPQSVTPEPRAVASGTGEQVTADFDPASLVHRLATWM